MARRRQSVQRPVGRGARLRKSWCRLHTLAVTNLTTTQAVIGTCVFPENVGEATLLRTRGSVLITAAPNAVTDVDIVGLGIIVVSATAGALGGTSVPGPLIDQGSDGWLWHYYVPLDAVTLTAGDPQAVTTNARFDFDSKAMRIVRADQHIVFIAELATGDFASVGIQLGIAWLIGE